MAGGRAEGESRRDSSRPRGPFGGCTGRGCSCSAGAGPFPSGTRYEASDPDLLLWVHATLIDTALLVHSRFFGEFDPGDRARYYDETKTIASLKGIPETTIPPTPRAFGTYMNGMLRSRKLTVTETGRVVVPRLARHLREFPQVRRPPAPARERRP